MSNAIKGHGTPKSPFDAAVRFVIQCIIDDPKISANRISVLAKQAKIEGLAGLDPGDLQAGPEELDDVDVETIRQGLLGHLIRLRVDPISNKNPRAPGTCFIKVKLKDKNLENRKEFEKYMSQVDGVIEWDLISSKEYDYLVRIVGQFGSAGTVDISDKIEESKLVKSSNFDGVQIMKSGVVDNIKPDDFYHFKDPQDE